MASYSEDTKTTRKFPKEKDPNEEYVEYTAPILDPKHREIVAAVNGETIRIKRGVPVKMKRKFLKVLKQSANQEMEAYWARERAHNQSQKAFMNL
jgi:hypothetical protein